MEQRPAERLQKFGRDSVRQDSHRLLLSHSSSSRRSSSSSSLLVRRPSRACIINSLAEPSNTRCSTSHTSRSEEHTSELQSPDHLVCRLLLEKKKIWKK